MHSHERLLVPLALWCSHLENSRKHIVVTLKMHYEDEKMGQTGEEVIGSPPKSNELVRGPHFTLKKTLSKLFITF